MSLYYDSYDNVFKEYLYTLAEDKRCLLSLEASSAETDRKNKKESIQ